MLLNEVVYPIEVFALSNMFILAEPWPQKWSAGKNLRRHRHAPQIVTLENMDMRNEAAAAMCYLVIVACGHHCTKLPCLIRILIVSEQLD